MDALSITLAAANIGTAGLLLVLLVPLLYDKVPRNRWYGFRFRASLASDDAWYAVNRYGARQMLGWTFGLLLLGIGCLFVPLQQHPPLAIVAGSASLVLLIPAVQAWLFARRYEVG